MVVGLSRLTMEVGTVGSGVGRPYAWSEFLRPEKLAGMLGAGAKILVCGERVARECQPEYFEI